ncbi:stringent starvation protein A [Halochromatium glycolicum]|uniref:Stringent starvation protein A n=2 Tax=Halochromatium glycolicum TaxID=85075 RepID=A0AAJ0U552_9GAMM|nr:stringent starvation protein A [Halochromatium glycolicum]
MAAIRRAPLMLFSDPTCPYCHRVRMVIAEKRINIDVIDVDAQALPSEVLEANPYGTVPTLVDRELWLYESLIVMEYLDERFPHPPLLPVDPVGRANARLFMYRIDRDWYAWMRDIRTGDAAAAGRARKALIESLTGVAPIFGASRFFMSDEFSLVDCCVAPLLWRLPVLELELPAAASPVTEYAARMFEWPSFRNSLTEAEREMVTDLA